MSEHDKNSASQGKRRSSKPVMQEDPLAWLTESDDAEADSVATATVNPEPADCEEATGVEPETDTASDDDDDWGLFDEPEAKAPSDDETPDNDESWGLFSAPSDAGDDSWGLFDDAVAGAPNRLELGDSLLLPEVAERHRDILISLREGPLEVNAGELERIDAAGLQLLCTLVQGERRIGRAVRWCAASSTLTSSAADLGLLDALGLEAA